MEKHSQSKMAMHKSHSGLQERIKQFYDNVEEQRQHNWFTCQGHLNRYSQNYLVHT
jgi:hypothetical protein